VKRRHSRALTVALQPVSRRSRQVRTLMMNLVMMNLAMTNPVMAILIMTLPVTVPPASPRTHLRMRPCS
jgi:hypothetical protein